MSVSYRVQPDIEPIPRISVIICTRNRAHALRESLDSVRIAAGDGAPSVELVVVDNGSTDSTYATVETWAKDLPPELPVRLVREPRAGLSIARNTGVANARGDIILFTDDDCRLESDYRDKSFAAVRSYGACFKADGV